MIGKRYEHGQKRTARILTSVAVACVLAALAVVPSFAATARATTMKLEKTEGTATLKTQNGTARKISNGMHLYSGNTLATAASSYAYVSLDGSKAVKLDEKTTTTLRQSGKQLELLVKSGKLFFNVSSPLTEKESMNVRTSSMVAGIRGTCGVVEYVNPNKSKLYLIQGQVTLGYGENATTIYGGQTATVILREKEEAGESGGSDGNGTPGDSGSTTGDVEQKVYVDKLTEANVPIFAITEILSDPVLQQKIEKATDLKITKFEEVLEESQNPEGTEEEKEEEQKPEETTSSGGSSGGSYDGGDSTGDVSSDPEPIGTTLDGGTVTAGAIKAAFDSPDCNTVVLAANGTPEDGTENGIDGTVEIPENKTLVVGEYVAFYTENITVGTGGALVIEENGLLGNKAALTNSGTITNNGTFENSGTITNSGIIANSGTISNDGTITGGGITLESGSELTNNESGTITGGITLGSGSTLTNSGTMTATSPWSVTNAIIDNDGKIDMGANAISVTGSLNLSSVGTITGNGAAVISLTGGGTLTLGSDSSSGGSISNTSENSAYYAIAVGNGSTITWNGRYVEILTGSIAETPVGNTIQNLTLANGAVTDSKSILKNITGDNLTWVERDKKLCYQL